MDPNGSEPDFGVMLLGSTAPFMVGRINRKACADKPAQAVATCVARLFVATALGFAEGKAAASKNRVRYTRPSGLTCSGLHRFR